MLIFTFELFVEISSLIEYRLLKFCYVPPTSATSFKAFLAFLLQPLTVLMRQTRQAVRAINPSIFLRCLCSLVILDVYGTNQSVNSMMFSYCHCRLRFC